VGPAVTSTRRRVTATCGRPAAWVVGPGSWHEVRAPPVPEGLRQKKTERLQWCQRIRPASSESDSDNAPCRLAFSRRKQCQRRAASTLWFRKNSPTLADYNYDPVQSILIIFSTLFVNDHKSCPVVKFFTSPHTCCHYTLWNIMLYFALITLLIAKIRVFFGWLWKEPVNYWSRCSNWRPLAFTHARSRAVHWSTASSTTHCGVLAQVSTIEALLQVDCFTDRRLVQTQLHAPNAVIDCSSN